MATCQGLLGADDKYLINTDDCLVANPPPVGTQYRSEAGAQYTADLARHRMLVRLRRGRLLSRLSISLASPITTFTGDRSGVTQHTPQLLATNTNSSYCVNLTAPYGVLYQTEKDEQCAGRHEHVDGLYVGDGRERLLAVGVLGGEG